IEEVAMQVVEEEWELRLTAILAMPQLGQRACRRVPEERAIVGLAIVVTGGAKQQWRPEDPQGGRNRPRRPQQRRVERREVRPRLIDAAGEEGGPDRVTGEGGEHCHHRGGQHPPWCAALKAVPGTRSRRMCGRA